MLKKLVEPMVEPTTSRVRSCDTFPGLPISCKKYPAFLTAEEYQFFSALEGLSQKIRTRFGQPQLLILEKFCRATQPHLLALQYCASSLLCEKPFDLGALVYQRLN